MEVMGFIAVLVNCALIGLSEQVNRLLPDMTAIQTVLLIVALEVCQSFDMTFCHYFCAHKDLGTSNSPKFKTHMNEVPTLINIQIVFFPKFSQYFQCMLELKFVIR